MHDSVSLSRKDSTEKVDGDSELIGEIDMRELEEEVRAEINQEVQAQVRAYRLSN